MRRAMGGAPGAASAAGTPRRCRARGAPSTTAAAGAALMRSATLQVPESQETKGPARPDFGGFLASLPLSAGRRRFQGPGRSGASVEAVSSAP
eukprot:1554226-Alexandrium_andersonii.AAC.1